jgi:predicted RNase H-like HicB family nuclease
MSDFEELVHELVKLEVTYKRGQPALTYWQEWLRYYVPGTMVVPAGRQDLSPIGILPNITGSSSMKNTGSADLQPASGTTTLYLSVESERETDGRWLIEIPELPGVMVYGKTENEALTHAQALALRVLAEQIDHGERTSLPLRIEYVVA